MPEKFYDFQLQCEVTLIDLHIAGYDDFGIVELVNTGVLLPQMAVA